MARKFGSYRTFSIGCFIIWALIFTYGIVFDVQVPDHALLYVFYGWFIGWLSATIVRETYKR